MFQFLSNFLFPKNCFGCGTEGYYLCSKCIKTKTTIRWDQTCHVCNQSTRLGFVHTECKEKTYVDGVFAAFVYDGVVKQLVLKVKYDYSYDIFKELGDFMAKFYDLLPKLSDVIVVPIPLFRSKKNLRGFNQAEVLAKRIAKRNKLVCINLLKRKRNTKTQVGMKKHEREVNLKEAFVLSKRAMKNLNTQKDYKFVLIDDVYTTGSTLNECTKQIKNVFSNAHVYGFTLVRAPGGSIE